MTRTQVFGLVTCSLIFSAATIAIVYINKDVAIKNAEVAAEINAQTEIEKTKIEEEEATKRTKERMNWIPWYSGGEN